MAQVRDRELGLGIAVLPTSEERQIVQIAVRAAGTSGFVEVVSPSVRAGIPLVMGPRDTRREENQKLFRLGNERLQGALDDQVSDGDRIPFLCECADEFCNGRVNLTIGEWQDVASKHNHFVMVSGHPRSEGEMVVGALDAYDVVRKPD